MNDYKKCVTYEQAVAIKSLGLSCLDKQWYDTNHNLRYSEKYIGNYTLSDSNEAVAPLQDTVCRRLRIGKNLDIVAVKESGNKYRYSILRVIPVAKTLVVSDILYKTHEDAISAGIDYVLKFLKGGEK